MPFAPPAQAPVGVEPPAPCVALQIRVPSTVSGGQELEYRICVSNQSQAAAHHVIVRNPLPANATFVRATPEPASRATDIVWRLGTLAPGAARELVLVLRPTGAGDITNCARVAFEHGQCVTTRIARPTLSLRKTAPEQVVLHDPITFRLEVTNAGSTPLSDVTLTDLLPRELRYDGDEPSPERRSLLTWNLGTLQPGENKVVEYRALTLEEGTFQNRAVVVAAGGLRQEASTRVTVGKPRLSLSMTGPEKRYANLPAVYQITLANPGAAPVTNVMVTNPLPAGMRLLGASDGGQQVDNEVRWALGTLAGGAKKALTVQLQLVQPMGAEIINRASVRADRDLTAQAEAKTIFQGVAGLTARLSDEDPVDVGREFAYVLVLKNTGTDAANDVKVTATIPAQLQSTDAQGPIKATLQGNKVIFDPIVLKAGQEVKYLIYVKAVKAGDVRFRVDIEARELTAGPLREEESTTVFEEPPGNGGAR